MVCHSHMELMQVPPFDLKLSHAHGVFSYDLCGPCLLFGYLLFTEKPCLKFTRFITIQAKTAKAFQLRSHIQKILSLNDSCYPGSVDFLWAKHLTLRTMLQSSAHNRMENQGLGLTQSRSKGQDWGPERLMKPRVCLLLTSPTSP